MMPTSPGHVVSLSLTNGHGSPYAAEPTTTNGLAPHSDSDMSHTHEDAVASPPSDVDAPGEDDDEEDVEMAQDSDSSDDVDAEGEADGDYDSESPPPEQAESDDARSSVSQESPRAPKRKASPKGDDYITQNPELYGLRRSVRGISLHPSSSANFHPGSCQASPSSRKPLRRPTSHVTYQLQVDSSDEDDDSGSDVPRKRQRTASRKSMLLHRLSLRVALINRHSVEAAYTRLPVGWLRL